MYILAGKPYKLECMWLCMTLKLNISLYFTFIVIWDKTSPFTNNYCISNKHTNCCVSQVNYWENATCSGARMTLRTQYWSLFCVSHIIGWLLRYLVTLNHLHCIHMSCLHCSIPMLFMLLHCTLLPPFKWQLHDCTSIIVSNMGTMWRIENS